MKFDDSWHHFLKFLPQFLDCAAPGEQIHHPNLYRLLLLFLINLAEFTVSIQWATFCFLVFIFYIAPDGGNGSTRPHKNKIEFLDRR